MKNNDILEQLTMSYMMRNNYRYREIESYHVGNIQYFKVTFWTPCVSYREFNGTLKTLIKKLSH